MLRFKGKCTSIKPVIILCYRCMSTSPILQLYGSKKQEFPESTIDLLQVTDELYHIMLYPIHVSTSENIKLTLVVIKIGIKHQSINQHS